MFKLLKSNEENELTLLAMALAANWAMAILVFCRASSVTLALASVAAYGKATLPAGPEVE